MKINWCKILGHKWIPVFTAGYFGKEKVKFIGTKCERCGFGEEDLNSTINSMDKNLVCSYNKKYYDR